MKEIEDDVPLPIKQKRLREKADSKSKQRIKKLKMDSRQASEIAKDIEESDEWLES